MRTSPCLRDSTAAIDPRRSRAPFSSSRKGPKANWSLIWRIIPRPRRICLAMRRQRRPDDLADRPETALLHVGGETFDDAYRRGGVGERRCPDLHRRRPGHQELERVVRARDAARADDRDAHPLLDLIGDGDADRPDRQAEEAAATRPSD